MACNVDDKRAVPGQHMMITSAHGNHWKFTFKPELRMLGDLVDSKAASEISMRHRMSTASGVFYSKKDCLCDKRFSPKKRLDNFYRFVGNSFLHMSSTWHLTKSMAAQIKAWENRKLRQ
eukprot:7277961-Karenia_brevis.AAC.1